MKPKITKYDNGNIHAIEYKNDVGKCHREDGPAFQYFYINGNIEYEAWYKNQKYHREDGPAKIYFYKNGNIEYESWYKNGNLEYETWYYENGNVKHVTWYINNKRHRIDGPAHIEYYENGNSMLEAYYINGKEISKQEFTILNRKRKLKLINETENN